MSSKKSDAIMTLSFNIDEDEVKLINIETEEIITLTEYGNLSTEDRSNYELESISEVLDLANDKALHLFSLVSKTGEFESIVT